MKVSLSVRASGWVRRAPGTVETGTLPGISIILSVPAKRKVVKMNEYYQKSTFKTEEHQCARYCFYKLLLRVSKVLSIEPRNSSMVQKFDTVSLQARPKMLCII